MAEVALTLLTKVFAYYGHPKILQSNTEMEFVNSIVRKLVDDWPGEITIINGHAQQLLSQSIIERGNAKVEDMLACSLHTQGGELRMKIHGHHGFQKFNVCLIM